jgi:hypothetical protein
MQESTIINLSADCVGLIKSNSDRRTETLFNELEMNIEQIKALLVGYYFASRQRVFDVQIDKGSLFIDPKGVGSFLVRYMLGMFNACADLDFTDKEKMRIEITINDQSGQAVLKGEYFPEREADEL